MKLAAKSVETTYMLYDWKKKNSCTQTRFDTEIKTYMINIIAMTNKWNEINITSGRNLYRWKSTFESSCEDKNEKKKQNWNKNGLGLSSFCYNKSLTQLQKVFLIFSCDLKKPITTKWYNLLSHMADVSDGKMENISSKITKQMSKENNT